MSEPKDKNWQQTMSAEVMMQDQGWKACHKESNTIETEKNRVMTAYNKVWMEGKEQCGN